MPEPRRPDRDRGVLETLLVVDGHPVELEAHLDRLESSLEELFPDRPFPDLRGDAPEVSGPYGYITSGTSAGEDPRVLRITVAPDRRGALRARAETRVASLGGEISLHSLTLAGGLGAHKWADRSLLDEAQRELPADSLPLIVDEGGTVLEASRANVFAVSGGALFTPADDGRILPGVTRMRILELAREIGIDVLETQFSRGDLLAADEVFLTGSVRGVERVKRVDGAPLQGGKQIADRLAAELGRSWAGAKTAPLR